MKLVVDSAWIDGTVTGPLALTIDGERLAAVDPAAASARGLHALPGFVNAHAHLELSSMKGELLPHGSFAEWVDALLKARAGLAPEAVDEAIRAGAAELLANGTVAVGDVDPWRRAIDVLRATALEGVVYLELLGAPSEQELVTLALRLAADARSAGAGRGLRLGLSPHAPYSTGESLYRRVFELARKRSLPIASHVAESLEEAELLERDAGPLARFFAERSFTKAAWSDDHASSFQRVRALAPPAGFVVIHGNLLRDEEIAECAARGWPIVYCPRSHRYFGHAPHPAPKVLAAGGLLALGTDSRASNGSLDPWREMACFREAHPEVPDAAILRAATASGRRALGLEPAGLHAGEAATFQVVRARDGGAAGRAGLEAAAVRGELETVAVFIRGRRFFGEQAEIPSA